MKSIYKARRLAWLCALLCASIFAASLTSLVAQQASAPPTPEEPLLDYYDGLRAWDLGEKTIAAGIWLRAAQRGDERAMVRVGQLFAAGEEFLQDDALAFFWLSVAAKAGREVEAEAQKIAAKLNREVLASLAEEVHRWKPESPLKPNAANQVRQYGATDLAEAINARDVAAIKEIVAGGVSPNYHTGDGMPLWLLAVAGGDVAVVEALFEAQAAAASREPRQSKLDPNAVVPGTSLRVLHITAMSGSASLVDLLLRQGANAALETPDGVTAAQIAERKGFGELKKRLEDAEKISLAPLHRALTRFEYISELHLNDRILRREAIKMYQKGGGEPPSGVVDVWTLNRATVTLDTRRFGTVIRFDKEGRGWVTHSIGYFRSALEARGASNIICQQHGGMNCRIDVVPAGACRATAQAPSHFYVSELRLEAAEAAQEALDLCRVESAEGCKEERRVCGDR